MYRLDISISFQSDELQGQYVPGSAMETPPFSRTEYQKPVYTNPSYENTHIYIYIYLIQHPVKKLPFQPDYYW